jgi:hypothetical protein
MTNRFSIGQLLLCVSLFAVAFACYRALGSRYNGALNLALTIGFCCAIGAAIGALWNRVATGAALGFAGFIAGCGLAVFR